MKSSRLKVHSMKSSRLRNIRIVFDFSELINTLFIFPKQELLELGIQKSSTLPYIVLVYVLAGSKSMKTLFFNSSEASDIIVTNLCFPLLLSYLSEIVRCRTLKGHSKTEFERSVD